MKTKLLAGVALLMIASGSALAKDLAVKPAAPAPVYKAPPMVPAVPPAGQDQTNPAPMTELENRSIGLYSCDICLRAGSYGGL